LSDKPVAKIESLYSPGDPVKAYIIKVDKEKRRISFGLKASYFDENDLEDDEEDDEDEDDVEEDDEDEDDEEEEEDSMAVDGEEDDEEEDGEEDEDEDIEMGEDDEDDEDDDEDDILMNAIGHDDDDDDDEMANDEDHLPSVREVEPLDLGGLGWGEELPTTVEDEDQDSELDDMEDGGRDNTASKKSRRAKKREKREAEERLAQQEKALLETQTPDSADAYERLLLGSPSSSFLWIKFMAFHLQMAEVQKAREVAERALKTINFRETQELMNIWVALLNLENTYGDRESLFKLFQKAVSFNEPKAMYLQMAAIYERTDKTDVSFQASFFFFFFF
jgi:rRNA biogenesis protein RRP5